MSAKSHLISQLFPTVSFSSIGLNNTIQHCTPINISYTSPSPPDGIDRQVQFYIIPSSSASLYDIYNATALDVLPVQSGKEGIFQWAVDSDIPEGMMVSAAVRSEMGVWGFSKEAFLVVANQNGSSCAPNDYQWNPAPPGQWSILHYVLAVVFGTLGGTAALGLLICAFKYLCRFQNSRRERRRLELRFRLEKEEAEGRRKRETGGVHEVQAVGEARELRSTSSKIAAQTGTFQNV